MFSRPLAFLLLAGAAYDQRPSDDLLAALQRHAAAFYGKARRVISEEELVQRCYTLPPHSRLAIGAAAAPLRTQFVVHEIVSQFSVGSLKGDPAGNLLEFREIFSKNDEAVQTPAAARAALAMDVSSGEDRVRKKILAEFTRLGLVDVATDYGLILLAFTKLDNLERRPAGLAWIGTEEAAVYDWQQKDGGALEFRSRKTTRRPMQGQIWLRRMDGLPLRVRASFEHAEPRHALRDDATVDFVLSSFGCVTTATVVHRHLVDGAVLTENLYTYSQFRLFISESTIRFSGPAATEKQ